MSASYTHSSWYCPTHIPAYTVLHTFQLVLSYIHSSWYCPTHIPADTVLHIFQVILSYTHSSWYCPKHIPADTVLYTFQLILSYTHSRWYCPTHIPADTVLHTFQLILFLIRICTAAISYCWWWVKWLSSRCICNFAELLQLTAVLQSYTASFVAVQMECASTEMRNKSYNGQSQMGVRWWYYY